MLCWLSGGWFIPCASNNNSNQIQTHTYTKSHTCTHGEWGFSVERDRECVSLNEGTRDPPLSCWTNDSGVHQLSGTPHWMTKHLRIQHLINRNSSNSYTDKFRWSWFCLGKYPKSVATLPRTNRILANDQSLTKILILNLRGCFMSRVMKKNYIFSISDYYVKFVLNIIFLIWIYCRSYRV